MRRIVRWIGGGLIVLVGCALVAYQGLPALVDARMNPVASHDSYKIGPEAAALHADITVADLHADTLLWARDPALRHDRGQTDIPRLIDVGVTLQVFAAVTKSPAGQNYDENTEGLDRITALAIAQGWPRRTWGSLEERARYQAERLHAAATKDERVSVVRTRQDVEAVLAKRRTGTPALGGILATEGSHALEGDIEAVGRLFGDGYRIMGLHHFFDNALGGSLHGITGAGLTRFGREALAEMDRLGVIVDVAHSAEAVVRDTLAISARPVILSHTGFDGHCPGPRNISDETMALIAQAGGLIGVGFWADVTCDDSPAGIADAIAYGIEAFGEDHIALGSDFDGTVRVALDASELAAITQALLDRGVAPQQIRKVMGENAVTFFAATLPDEPR